jgi:hypothetical protein
MRARERNNGRQIVICHGIEKRGGIMKEERGSWSWGWK